jgi:hypothetical protein
MINRLGLHNISIRVSRACWFVTKWGSLTFSRRVVIILRQRMAAIVDPCSNLGISDSTVGRLVYGAFLNILVRILSATI